MIAKLKLYILLFCLTMTSGIFAQQAQVGAQLDSTHLFIGQQSLLRLQAIVPEGSSVVFPAFKDTIVKGMEVLQVLPVDTTRLKGGLISFEQPLLITAWDSALYYVPHFEFVVNQDTILSKGVTLKVSTFPVEEGQLFDIKDILPVPFVWTDYLIYLYLFLGLVLLALVLYYGYRWWEKRRDGYEPASVYVPLIPAADEARDALTKLKQQELWQRGMEKEYHTTLTDILRHYLDRRYGINAMEMTSGEILTALRSEVAVKPHTDDLRFILELADVVKFAKFHPLPEENEKSFFYVEHFVNETEEKPEVAATEEDVKVNSSTEQP